MPATQPPVSDPVAVVLDELIGEVQRGFHALLLAQTTLQLGGGVLDSIQDNVAIETALGIALTIEPLPIGELRQYKASFPDFILQVFHGKLVQLWHECLLKIFCHYVDLHLQGMRPFVELRKQDVRIDFAVSEQLQAQVRRALTRDFDFKDFAERQKLINKLRNPVDRYADHLQNIHKHVQIRNAFQHRQGMLDTDAIKKLGVSAIELLDADGKSYSHSSGDRVTLSIPEVDSFRKSILLVSQAWRT